MVSQQKNVKVTIVVDENLKVIGNKFKTSVTGELLKLVLDCLGYGPALRMHECSSVILYTKNGCIILESIKKL